MTDEDKAYAEGVAAEVDADAEKAVNFEEMHKGLKHPEPSCGCRTCDERRKQSKSASKPLHMRLTVSRLPSPLLPFRELLARDFELDEECVEEFILDIKDAILHILDFEAWARKWELKEASG